MIVVENLPHEIFLGGEMISRHKVCIDEKYHKLRLASGSVPLHHIGKSITFGVVVPETVTVRAKHEMIFPSQLDGDYEGDGYVEGQPGVEKSSPIIVARVAVTAGSGTIPV